MRMVTSWRWWVWLLLCGYSAWLILAYRYHFIDHVNLAFHEAGHIIFIPLGDTLSMLGGTIAQLFFPAATAFHFLRRGQRFEMGVAGVWFAESLLYMATYMDDAEARLLPLVGGGRHDWHTLFSRWGVLEHSGVIATLFQGIAALLLIATLIYLYRLLRRDGAWREPAL